MSRSAFFSRGALALLLSLMSAAPVAAQETPSAAEARPVAPASAALTDEDVDRFMGWMGLVDAIPVIVRSQFERTPALQKATDAQQACVTKILVPPMQAALRVNFRELLGNRDNYLGWEAFSSTAGGKRMFEQVRAQVQSKLNGGAAPAKSAGAEDMSEEEMRDIMQFMLSPAAGILSKPFPDIDPPRAMLEALADEVKTQCGLDVPV
jgi:hypothetical protein